MMIEEMANALLAVMTTVKTEMAILVAIFDIITLVTRWEEEITQVDMMMEIMITNPG